VICTLSAVLCIPEGEAKPEGIHKTALRVQITYTLEAMVQLTFSDLYHSAPLIVNYVFTILKRTPQVPSNEGTA